MKSIFFKSGMLSTMMMVLYLTSLQSISAKEYRQDVVSTLFGNVWKSAKSKVLGEAATDDISTVPSTQDEKNMIPLESTEFRKFSTPDSSASSSTNFELKEGVVNSSQPPQFPNDNNSNNSIFSNPTGTESGIVESAEIHCGIENCTTLATPEVPDTRVVDWGVLLDPLKSINPSQLTNLLDQVKESLADILAGERLGGTTKDSIVDYFDSFSRNVIGFAKETYEILKNETAQLETQEMESMLDNFRQKVKTKLDGSRKIDEMCNIFEAVIAEGNPITGNGSQDLYYLSAKHHSVTERIFMTIKRTCRVLCRDSNRQLLSKFLRTWDLWANQMPKKVLARAINKIAGGKPILKFILELVLGVAE